MRSRRKKHNYVRRCIYLCYVRLKMYIIYVYAIILMFKQLFTIILPPLLSTITLDVAAFTIIVYVCFPLPRRLAQYLTRDYTPANFKQQWTTYRPFMQINLHFKPFTWFSCCSNHSASHGSQFHNCVDEPLIHTHLSQSSYISFKTLSNSFSK